MYKRVLLKISGEALSSESAPLCQETIEKTAADIAWIQKKGVAVGIVVGGGNILRGRSSGQMERNRADHMGMLATAINALALQDALERMGVPCSVLSAVDMPKFCDGYTARAARQRLSRGEVVIFACGTGCPFFSTETGAEVLLLAKNVDAVYSADPLLEPDAKPYARLSYDRVIADNLKATDLTAITLCREQRIPIHVFALSQIRAIFDGAQMGTIIDDIG